VGGKLANYLMEAGFQNVTTTVLTHQYDNRTPKKRAAFLDYWVNLLLSGAENLVSTGRVTQETVREMQNEMEERSKLSHFLFVDSCARRGLVGYCASSRSTYAQRHRRRCCIAVCCNQLTCSDRVDSDAEETETASERDCALGGFHPVPRALFHVANSNL